MINSMGTHSQDHQDVITDIIAEFTDVLAFSRTNWTRFAEEVDAEVRGLGMIVLQFISRKGPITATGISQSLDMDKSLVSRQLARLRELDLIETSESPDDRRVQVITASAKAKRVIGKIRELWANSYRERFEGWSSEELDTLQAGLHRFNASAQEREPYSPCAR